MSKYELERLGSITETFRLQQVYLDDIQRKYDARSTVVDWDLQRSSPEKDALS